MLGVKALILAAASRLLLACVLCRVREILTQSFLNGSRSRSECRYYRTRSFEW